MIDWRIEIERNNFRNEVDDSHLERGKWETVIDEISKKILINIETLDEFSLHDIQLNCNSQDKEKVEIIVDCINEKKWPSLEGEMRKLAKLLGEKIAINSSEQFEKWEIIGQKIKNCWPLFESWIEFLPIEDISKNQDIIEQYPNHNNPLELIDTWGVYREKKYWPNVFSHIEECNQFIYDPWLYVEKVSPRYEEFRLKSSMMLRNDLVQKLGWETWLLWVADFPIIYMKQAVIYNINDLDIIKKLIAQVSIIEKIEPTNKMILIVLLIRRFLELCEHIQRNLDYAVKRIEPDEKGIDFKQELKNWEETESFERISSLIDEVVAIAMRDEIGFQIMSSMFKHLEVVSEKKNIIRSQLRTLLISNLAKMCEASDCYKRLLEELNSQTKLLNAAMLFFCLEDSQDDLKQQIIKMILNQYANLLISEKYLWHGNLSFEGDEGKLLWYLSGVISYSNDPYSELTSLVERVLIKSGGWKYNYVEYLESITKVTHCLTVGTMMAEWMQRNGKIPEASIVYRYIWSFAHDWIRWIFDDRNESVTALLISLWARLILVCPDNYVDMTLEASNKLDSLKQQITCLKVLRQNLRNKEPGTELPLTLQKHIYTLFEKSFVVEKQLTSEQNEVAWFTNSIVELTPNI
ncbi:hypothetical protein [Pelosinus sp. sgz500959]|uniref:hypothetical protein n=1 Tax=Pelosinus sp. sgz500959 TaxID=3242472 RepID=UPI00366ECA30